MQGGLALVWSGARQVRREQLEAMTQERIRVPHEEHGHLARRERRTFANTVGERRPIAQRGLARALHGGAVGQRVAEWDTELDHVRARLDGRAGQPRGGATIGKTDGEVDEDRETALLPRARERPREAHLAGARWRFHCRPITVSRSL